MRILCGMKYLFRFGWLLAALLLVCVFPEKATSEETKKFIKHGDGMMIFVPVAAPNPGTYLFEMPPAWSPDSAPAQAAPGSWYGKHLIEDAKVSIIPFFNQDNLKLEEIAKLIKKKYFNDGECSLDDFHRDYSFKPSLLFNYETYYYENCPQGKSNLFVICEVADQLVFIFNLNCDGTRLKNLGQYFEDLDRILRRFKWEIK